MGFFEPTTWTGQRQPMDLVAECGQCGLHKLCKSPFMPVTGAGRKKALIVAEAPGETEDERNAQLVGNAGMELVRLFSNLGFNMRKDCWLTNALLCRPYRTEGRARINREPTKDEISYCRPNLARTIKELNPDVVIPLGRFAVMAIMPLIWRDGEVEEVTRWVGWRIPSCRLNTWVCPSYHPSFLLWREGESSSTNARAIEFHMSRHLRDAMRLVGKPWPDGPPDWESMVDIEMDPRKAADKIRKMMRDYPNALTAFDFETTCLKPYGPYAEILCCSVSNGERTISYPWLAPAIEATREFVVSPIPKAVANLRMEQGWCAVKLGTEVRNWQCDVTLQAHHQDCRGGITSLKFQALTLFGVDDYDSYLEPYKQSEDSNSPNRLKEVDRRKLLMYCGLDSLFEWMIATERLKYGSRSRNS